MVGKRFGRLVGVSFVETSGKKGASGRWLFQCDCGSKHDARGADVRNGKITSCGCYKAENSRSRMTVHGMKGTSEYCIWKGMRQRCGNPKDPSYKNYGGRGITVCDEWIDSFQRFYADMGPKPRPGLTVERKNNNLGYCASNCVWATRKAQRRNQRRLSMNADLADQVKTLRDAGGNVAAWARQMGISRSTAHSAATGKSWK